MTQATRPPLVPPGSTSQAADSASNIVSSMAGHDEDKEEEREEEEDKEEGEKEEDKEEEGEEEEDKEEEEEKDYISMRELYAMLHPLESSLPYIYDDLTTWGGKPWEHRDS